MKRFKTAVYASLLVLAPLAARAHLRDYLDVYGYPTLEKGRTELELWTDLRDPDGGDAYWHHQTEVEYGVTDRYTLGVYGVFIDGRGFSALKVENRYRLTQPGQAPVDVAGYLEFKKANGRKEEDEIEAKLILSKTVGRVNVTANPILAWEKERHANGDTEWEAETALALGVSRRHWWRKVTPGLELFLQENKSRLTPGLYIDLAPDVRLNLGVGIGVEKHADNAQLKSILEVEF